MTKFDIETAEFNGAYIEDINYLPKIDIYVEFIDANGITKEFALAGGAVIESAREGLADALEQGCYD